MASSKVYTVKEVARLLEFSTNTVYKYLNEGKIQAQRLDENGRFRIPESEIARLLGLKGKTPESQPPARVETTPSPAPTQVYLEKQEDILANFSLPGLFDWFIATLGIFTIISSLLFPEYLQTIELKNYLSQIQYLKIALAFSGILLIGVNILKIHKGRFHKFMQLILAALFAILAFILFRTGSFVLAAGYSSVALTIFITALLKINDDVRFTSFLAIFFASLGLVYTNVASTFPIKSVSDWITNNSLIFASFWYVSIWLILTIGIYFSQISKKFKTRLCLAIAACFLVYAIFLVNGILWEQAVYFLITGSFTMLLPFAKRFASLDLDSEKNLFASFAWVIVVFVVGIGLVFYLQYSFKNYLVEEDKKRLAFASNLIENYIKESKNSLGGFSSNSELTPVVDSTLGENKNLDKLLKEFYLGTTNFRRITVFDQTGKGLAAYPADKNVNSVDISDKDYFTHIKNDSSAIISQGLESSLAGEPAGVVITVPILDKNKQLAGVLLGSIDLVRLGYLLNNQAQSSQRHFAIADRNKKIILHPDGDQILKPVIDERALALATDGQSGAFADYTSRGVLSLQSFAPIESLGWGLVVEQPFFNVARQNSNLSFIIFLITIFVGIGSLLEVISSRKRVQSL